jgi:hypothetical protein
MRCLDATEREKLLDLIVEAKLVEVVYARVQDGAVYLTIQRRKSNGHIGRATDTSRLEHRDEGELFAE